MPTQVKKISSKSSHSCFELTSSWGICWWPFASWWTGQSVCSGRRTTPRQNRWQYCRETNTGTQQIELQGFFYSIPDIKNMNSGKSNLKLDEFKLIIHEIFLSPTTKKELWWSFTTLEGDVLDRWDGCKCNATESYLQKMSSMYEAYANIWKRRKRENQRTM